jgi:hypothetical protein
MGACRGLEVVAVREVDSEEGGDDDDNNEDDDEARPTHLAPAADEPDRVVNLFVALLHVLVDVLGVVLDRVQLLVRLCHEHAHLQTHVSVKSKEGTKETRTSFMSWASSAMFCSIRRISWCRS